MQQLILRNRVFLLNRAIKVMVVSFTVLVFLVIPLTILCMANC